MTVANTLRKAGPFTGNGVTTAFPFTFKCFATSDLVVTELTIATNVETTKTLTTHYTVSLNADQDTSPGGTVNAVVAPSSAVKWTITSAVPAAQSADLISGGAFYPKNIEDSLDKLTILVQQLQELQSRSLLLPVSFNLTALLPAATPFNHLGWNAAGTALVNYTPGQGDVTVQQIWQANQSIAPVALTSVSNSIAVNAALSNNFTHTLTENTTLANPTGLTDGMHLFFRFKQHASSAKTLAFDTKYKFDGGSDPVIPTSLGSKTIMSCYYNAADDELMCVFNGTLGFS